MNEEIIEKISDLYNKVERLRDECEQLEIMTARALQVPSIEELIKAQLNELSDDIFIIPKTQDCWPMAELW